MAERVDCTPKAASMIDTLVAMHGPVLFHQSGGCCDGSAPMCYQRGEFRIGGRSFAQKRCWPWVRTGFGKGAHSSG